MLKEILEKARTPPKPPMPLEERRERLRKILGEMESQIDFEIAYRLGKQMLDLGNSLAREEWGPALDHLDVLKGMMLGLGWLDKEASEIIEEIKKAIKAKDTNRALISFTNLDRKILKKLREMGRR